MSNSIHDVVETGERINQTRSNRQLTWEELCLLNQTLLRKCPGLRGASISEDIRGAVHNNTVNLLIDSVVDGRCQLNPDNYIKTLRTLLFAEEYYESVEMRKHDQFDRYLNMRSTPRIRLHGLSKGQPSLIPKDLVVLDNINQYVKCEISSINRDDILFRKPFNARFHGTKRRRIHYDWMGQFDQIEEPFSVRLETRTYDVAFVSSGVTYQRYHKTLGVLASLEEPTLIGRMYFDEQTPLESAKIDKDHLRDPDCKDALDPLDERLSKCNERQQQAIVAILEARCRPKPYILFGPPGTGKSFTLLEAVVQICGREPWRRLLVTANSNNCADQLFVGLRREENARIVGSLARLSSHAHHQNSGTEFGHNIDFKSLQIHGGLRYRVIVTTNNMSGALDKNKFDYVLIDEAGHGHEAEILHSASLLKENGLLVLAGDPKQLGPVIHNPQVERLGLGQSMLERMFNLGVYARDPDEGYDKNYITKLTVCYRCDPRILELSNKLFYHDELRCLGKTPPSLMRALDVSHPLLFCPVEGSQDRIHSSTSIRNHQEAQRVVDIIIHYYKMGIDPEKIGVISFYTLQQNLIKSQLIERLKLELFQIKKAIQRSNAVADNLDILTIKGHSKQEDISFDSFLEGIMAHLGDNETSDGDSANDIRVPYDLICKVDTVDGFQGQEREIIIISTVRCPDASTNTIKNCGFLADSKRFNVALSRAKWLAIVVGHPAVLDCHENWLEFKRLKAEYEFEEVETTE